ncbi:MAG: hypothetical protein NTU73_15700 [Ignavibacteriae bacterium]|nr:hypothetical protein [Ignavibacteriota bacterium]
MYLTYCTGANISQNTVQNILTSVTTPIGMYIYTGVVNSTISKNNINNIVFTGSGGYGGRGLYVSTGNAASNLTIANNIIYVIGGDGYTSFSNSSPVGMFFDGTTGGLNIYYNSVYMSGNLTYAAATLTATILFNTTTVTNVDCRDNIFQNSLNNTANATAKNYAIYSTAPATSFTQINYNDYWVTGTQGILGFLGADQTSLVAWQTATGKDVNSIFADPQFQTTTDLRPMIGSPVLLAGTPIAGITDDYTGSLRSVTNPTIGAYERGTDLVGPNISYVNLPNTTSTSNITTSNWATMTDASGINTTTGTAPRIYYKKSWHNNTIVDNTSFTNGWKWTEAISISSPFDFVIDYSLIFGGGVATGDNIMYFVVAQDNYSTPNISIKSGTFASQPTSVDLTVSAFPIGGTVYSYSIMSAAPLSGDYTVGLTMFNLITGKNLEPKEFTRSSKKEESKKGNMDNLTNDDNKKSKTGNNTDRVQSDKVSTNERYIALSENGIEYKGPMYVKFTPEIRKKYNLSDYMTGNYANISSALSDLYAVGMSSSVRFLLTDANYGSVGTPENLPINLGPVTGAGPSSTITILPQGGNNVIITGDNTTSVFDFNGGNYFIFDGRPNGSSTPKQLTIRNISTSNTATTMRFINDACQNKIQYCIIEGSGSGVYPVATNGTITFGTTTGIRGNDSNYVANNDIRDRSDATGTPNYAIYSTGSTTTVAQYNSDNFITDNNIFNFYNDGNISSGCFLTTGTGDNWVVTGNSFYQTDERVTTSTNYTCWNVVFFGTTTINNINVSNNYIGGSAPNCGGSPWRVTNGTVPTAGSPTFIYVIRGSLGSTTASSFQNNTVANYLMNVYAALTAGSTMFSGMILSSGWADVGTITGNTIGNNTGNGSIEINFFGTNTFAPGVAGIDHRISGSVNNNTVGSFTMNAPSTMTGGYTFNGITKSGTPVAAMTISNNTVGSSTVTNSIQNTSDTAFCVMTGISSSTATVNLTMNNNTVANLTNMSINTGTTNYVRGIIHTGTAIDAITNNIVKNLYSMSGNTSTFSTVTNAVIGIGSSSAAIGQNISGNTISGLRSATVITNNTYAIGLGVTSSTSTGTIERNRIFDITNTSTGAAPYIIGINNYWGTWTIPNNQITITNGELTDNIRKNNNTTNLDVPSSNNINVARNIVNNSIANNIKDNLSSPIEIRNYFGRNNLRSYDGPVDAVVEEIQSENKNTSRRNKITDLDRSTNGVVIYGIFDDASTIGSYYYNSVYIGGSAATGTSNSYAFYRLGTPNIVLRNNLFYNGRINSGTASGKHYAIASSGITAINPNYNSYVTANANTMGFWNASDQTFATWKTATTADAFSYATTSSIISATNLFSSISTGNLNILSGNTEAWLVSGKGTYIAGQTTDFDGVDSRSVTIAGGITDIGSDEFTATPPNCPVAVESAPPSAGIITTYTIYNRTLVDIFWSTGGSSYPTNVNVRYYSGITPPNSTGNNAFSYCDVNPIGTLTGATYDITNYFTDAETYTIVNPTTDTRLAKYSNSEWWVYGDLGTGNLQTELNWAGKWAKVRGLDAFSYFTFSDITNPLPVQLTAFTSSVSGRDVKLNWITEREQNNAGYEIQRIKNTELNSGNWVKVGYIKSAGNSNKPTSYTFNDKKLNSGKYNYRLRQIDNLGTSH